MTRDELKRIREDLEPGGYHRHETDLPLFDDACALLARIDEMEKTLKEVRRTALRGMLQESHREYANGQVVVYTWLDEQLRELGIILEDGT